MVTPKVISSCGISACHIPLRHRSLTNTRRKKENVLSSSERIPHPLDQSQVLDSDGKRKGFYRVVASDDGDGGLAVDNEGNIYISYVASSIISMYQPDGTPLGTFGQPGSRIGEFRAPRGLWVDGNNRIYVSDTGNARVQVFQVSVTEPPRR
jgi:DNA-binding beta-propeller fold protein YncE